MVTFEEILMSPLTVVAGFRISTTKICL